MLLAMDYFYGGKCNSSHYYIDTLFSLNRLVGLYFVLVKSVLNLCKPLACCVMIDADSFFILNLS